MSENFKTSMCEQIDFDVNEIEIMNAIKLSELNELAKQAGDPTIILVGSGRILLEEKINE